MAKKININISGKIQEQQDKAINNETTTNAWDYDFSNAKTPDPKMFAGKQNVGKVLKVDERGFITPQDGGSDYDDTYHIIDWTDEGEAPTNEKLTLKEYMDKVKSAVVPGGYVPKHLWIPTYTAILDMMYPIGSIYMTIEKEFNPNNEFVGKWILLPTNYCIQSKSPEEQFRSTTPAGAPDIIGRLQSTQVAIGAVAKNGCINVTNSGNARYGTSASEVGNAFEFKASDGEMKLSGEYHNDVYGKSDTIQPQAYNVYIWRRVKDVDKITIQFHEDEHVSITPREIEINQGDSWGSIKGNIQIICVQGYTYELVYLNEDLEPVAPVNDWDIYDIQSTIHIKAFAIPENKKEN